MAQIFPKWSNKVPAIVLLSKLIICIFIVFVFWYWFSPYNLNVGYEPEQPIQYSHKLHAGDLGIDCRYCHTGVEKSAIAGVPSTQTCMNCHQSVKVDPMKLEKVFESWKTDKPIEWVKVHKLADYVYFNHSAHVLSGVSCVKCHGRVDQMQVVRQEEPLSMAWCLKCHRDPGKNLVPKTEVTNLGFKPSKGWLQKAKKRAAMLHPPTTNCAGCHQ